MHQGVDILVKAHPKALSGAIVLGDEALGGDGAGRELVFLDVAEEELVERLTGRLTCTNCGNAHHLRFAPPASEGVCDVCGNALEQRKDDSEDVVRNRLAVLPVVRSSIVTVIR